MRVYVAVIEEGSFTGASNVLYMTQSGVSRAVASMESELGLPLLIRSRSGVTPTDAGERVLVHARAALSEMERIRQDAAAMAGLEVGRLRIGGFPSACARLMPGIIGEFERRYPSIEILVSEGTDQKVSGWIHENAIDVGFVHLPSAGLHTVPIAVDKMLLVLPPGHPLAETSSVVSTSRLSSEPLILPRGRSEPIVASIFREAGIAPKVRFMLRDVGTVLSMVREGMGVSILAQMSLTALPGLLSEVSVRSIEPTAERQIGLAVRSEEAVLPAVEAFIEVARSWTEKNGCLPV